LPTFLLVLTALGIAAGGTTVADPDPRVALIDAQMADQHHQALEHVETFLRQEPEAAHRAGYHYLRAHLLLRLDRRPEALAAFAATLTHTPALEPFSRFRLAMAQEEEGHPEVAAGLVATLLGSNPPATLSRPAMGLLVRTINAGGDCRLLRNLDRIRWKRGERRALDLARADCLERGGDLTLANQERFKLLKVARDDRVALAAAEHLTNPDPSAKRGAREHLLLGLTFYNHREFGRAIHHLARTLVQLPTATNITSREAFECRYALARCHFWEGRYKAAANAYGTLATQSLSTTRRAQVLYQRGRSLELGNQWPEAITAFRLALKADPRGRWSDAALIASMRLHWLTQHESEALAEFQDLLTRRKNETASRAALFLATSDLVQGRADRAQGWLETAERLRRVPQQELDFWRGRLEENRNQPARAVEFYTRALAQNPYHPFAQAARRHLAAPEFQGARKNHVRRLAASSDIDDLYAAWLLLAKDAPRRRQIGHTLETRLRAEPAAVTFLDLERAPITEWSLWKNPLKRPEELLLALGIFDEGAALVLRHFPVATPALAVSGSFMLSHSGAIHRSLYIAEVLSKRIPTILPPQFLSREYRQLLFPFGYSYFILRESQRRGIDPYLLAGLIREESRFDPGAFSGAAARGLTQFVLPTAKRVSQKIDLGAIKPEDLANPEISIALGAAYLEELLTLFSGELPPAVAAYNAGESQAHLWQRYCLSANPEEFLTKLTFRETRAYVGRVLNSRAHYQELYGDSANRE
jgi:soluble lytic murein transglycosylase-like protein